MHELTVDDLNELISTKTGMSLVSEVINSEKIVTHTESIGRVYNSETWYYEEKHNIYPRIFNAIVDSQFVDTLRYNWQYDTITCDYSENILDYG